MATLRYHADDRHATWLELFFDLVFVASIGVITHHLAHSHDGHLDARQAWLFPLELIPVWWIWATHTLYSNFRWTLTKDVTPYLTQASSQ